MPKLPMWRTVGAAYGFVFGQPLAVLRAIWPWVVLQGAFFIFPALNTFAARISPIFSESFSIVVSILLIASVVSGSVAIHRSIILSESSWHAALRFGRREWRFLGMGLLIALTMLMPMLGFQTVVFLVVFPVVFPMGVP